MTSQRCCRVWAVAAVVLAVCLPARTTSAANWDPVDPAQLAATTPFVDPNADVEALVWDVSVEHVIVGGDEPQTYFKHYLRLKVYTERGVDSTKQVEIPFGEDTLIADLAARTIRPDGTIVEVKGGDFFERTLTKAGGRKVKVKSFAVPALVPGAIVDYRWSERHTERIEDFVRLDLQRDVPVREVRHHVKPLALLRNMGYQMNVHWFHQPAAAPVKDPLLGFTSFTYRDVPAFKEEPLMAPEYSLRRWLLVYYKDAWEVGPDKFWKKMSRDLWDPYKPSRLLAPEVPELAVSAVGSAATTAEKVSRLVAACRSRVKRVDLDTSGLGAAERKKLKTNRDSGDTLKRGTGTGADVIRLFLDLSTAIGLDARLTALPDGSFHPFDPSFANAYFLVSRSVAVRDGNGWLFVDPAQPYLPPGMLRWQEEGQVAVIADPEQALLVATPNSAPQKSLARREAKLRLSEDGTIEGDVREELSGHLASQAKHENDDLAETQRGDALREQIQRRFSTAELSAVSFENALDPDLPFVRRYHVRVPGYAQRTGRRLFLQPSFFETGSDPVFSASTRQHPIVFPFAWSEEDHVVVELPEGFALEQPSLPQPIRSGEVASYSVAARVVDGKSLVFDRKFHFGGQGALTYGADSYPVLKQFFDSLHEKEEHSLTLAQAVPKAAAP